MCIYITIYFFKWTVYASVHMHMCVYEFVSDLLYVYAFLNASTDLHILAKVFIIVFKYIPM